MFQEVRGLNNGNYIASFAYIIEYIKFTPFSSWQRLNRCKREQSSPAIQYKHSWVVNAYPVLKYWSASAAISQLFTELHAMYMWGTECCLMEWFRIKNLWCNCNFLPFRDLPSACAMVFVSNLCFCPCLSKSAQDFMLIKHKTWLPFTFCVACFMCPVRWFEKWNKKWKKYFLMI